MDNKTKNSAEYLKTRVFTASPEQLQLMLYDGALRFCEQARLAIQNKEIETSYNLIAKAENIVMELCNSMRDEIAPETCSNMRRLYLFCYNRLITANIDKNLDALDEAVRILRHLRETWLLLMDKLRAEKPASLPASPPPPADRLLPQEVGATINFEG